MELKNIKVYSYNTTLIGVIKSVSEYFNFDYSDAMIFGGSGHAFLINLHNQLCPSGPYCWKYDGFLKLLENLGILMQDLGFFHPQSTSEQREMIEQNLIEKIKNGLPCSLINLENQLILGYNRNRFQLGQPWGDKPELTPSSLSFKTWKEFGYNYHVTFFAFNKKEPNNELTSITDSIKYAIDLFENPQKYELNKDYGIGLNAFENWEKAINNHDNSHGNFWNSAVWSECRKMASLYFVELSKKLNGSLKEINTKLSKLYLETSSLLKQIGNDKINIEEKINSIRKAKQNEIECIKNLKELIKTNEYHINM